MKPTLLTLSVLAVAMALPACKSKSSKKPTENTSSTIVDITKNSKDSITKKALESDTPLLASTASPPMGAIDGEPKGGDKIADTDSAAETDAHSAADTAADYEPTLAEYDGVSLRRLITAPEIESREPVAAGSLFGHYGEPIYAFMDVKNQNEYERELTVNFIGPNGEVRGGVKVMIPANVPRWRTWAFTKHANAPGTWRVEVRSEDASLLGTLLFDVEEGC